LWLLVVYILIHFKSILIFVRPFEYNIRFL